MYAIRVVALKHTKYEDMSVLYGMREASLEFVAIFGAQYSVFDLIKFNCKDHNKTSNKTLAHENGY